ncbi:hypothetical protein [Campylobacter sp. 19-13652]|uniref:hypothetical protein n=1 Tax=Campylobacter sp. 19-13652 TaxID=2840180 RepID=UPI001C769A17|nr:hypothetical protein [Campylobacter sp. 19-13652]BCX79035.1 hypothetical protein LBC_04970 [Campylobacter sp. 19-13652]
MRFTLVVAFFVGLFFYGCASVDTPEQAAKNELLEYTDKASFISEQGSVLVVASYLNPVKYPKKLDEEVFGVAVSPAGASFDSAVLEGVGAASIERTSDEVAKGLGFYLPWASYYIVKAPALEAKSLRLDLGVGGFIAKLDFVKVSRSLYWHR